MFVDEPFTPDSSSPFQVVHSKHSHVHSPELHIPHGGKLILSNSSYSSTLPISIVSARLSRMRNRTFIVSNHGPASPLKHAFLLKLKICLITVSVRKLKFTERMSCVFREAFREFPCWFYLVRQRLISLVSN